MLVLQPSIELIGLLNEVELYEMLDF